MNENMVSVSLHEAHLASVAIFELLLEKRVGDSTAVASVALTLGRMAAGPQMLQEAQEVEFIQDMVQWAVAYWAKGAMN